MPARDAARVVVLVENLPVPLDRRTWQEARTLAAAGFDVTVIGPRGGGQMRRLHDRLDGVRVYRYPQRAAGGLAGYLIEYAPSMAFTAIYLAWTRLRHGPIAVIHGCNPPDLFWIFGLLARLGGAHFVFDQHDANVELAATKWPGSGPVSRLLVSLTRWLERRSYRTASLVIAPNESYRQIATGRGGVPEARVVLVRNAPDVARYRRLAAGIQADGRRVGYVGVMGSQDGLELLIDAWAMVTRQADLADARLELVGDGEARPALEARAAGLGIADRVTFHGFQPPEVFVPILARCRLGVSPDPPTPFNAVSTMVKVLDYLAIGRPVISFDLPETRLLAGEAGTYVAPPTPAALAEAIAAALRDDAATTAAGAAAAQRPAALGLDWSASGQRLVDAYRRLAGDRFRAGAATSSARPKGP